MTGIARVGSNRIPGEPVISADQLVHAAPVQVFQVLDAALELVRYTAFLGDLPGDAPRRNLVQCRVEVASTGATSSPGFAAAALEQLVKPARACGAPAGTTAAILLPSMHADPAKAGPPVQSRTLTFLNSVALMPGSAQPASSASKGFRYTSGSRSD